MTAEALRRERPAVTYDSDLVHEAGSEGEVIYVFRDAVGKARIGQGQGTLHAVRVVPKLAVEDSAHVAAEAEAIRHQWTSLAGNPRDSSETTSQLGTRWKELRWRAENIELMLTYALGAGRAGQEGSSIVAVVKYASAP